VGNPNGRPVDNQTAFSAAFFSDLQEVVGGAWQGRSAAHGSHAAGYLLRYGARRQGRDFEKP
jgi:hypothetical protein